MTTDILMAIESICDDIATNPDAGDNYKRAEAILLLAFSSLFVSDEEDDLDNEDKEERTVIDINENVPKAGQHFHYHGIEFVALGEEQGGLLAVVAERLKDEMPFDKNGSNDWSKSTLCEFLNEEYIKNFDKADLLPIISDLTADNGDRYYETSVDYIALLSDTLYRKYRDFMPKYDTWVWTITPWSVLSSSATFGRFINTNGALNVNDVLNSNGVAPACIFNPSIFE